MNDALVEMVAKAIHDSHEYDLDMFFGTWEEEVARDDDRTRRGEWAGPYVSDVRNEARAAIAVIAEALVQPEAVEAAGKSLYEGVYSGGGCEWESARRSYRSYYDDMAEDALKAAMTALGGEEANNGTR